MVTRPRVLAAGVAVIIVYAALAAWSGHLSPLARRPLLDGNPALPYRWVNPPPELAATNQPPESGEATLKLTPKGVRAQVVFTSDEQATVVVGEGVIPAHGHDDRVEMKVVPMDPAPLEPPGDGLAFFGNAYRVTAIYEPSNTTVRKLATDTHLDVTLAYPATATLNAARHTLLYSRDAAKDGVPWTSLESSDTPGLSQAEALAPGPGDVVVAGEPGTPIVTVAPGNTGGGSGILRPALIVGAVCAFLIGIGFLLRSRSLR